MDTTTVSEQIAYCVNEANNYWESERFKNTQEKIHKYFLREKLIKSLYINIPNSELSDVHMKISLKTVANLQRDSNPQPASF